MKIARIKSVKLYLKGLKGLHCLEKLVGQYGTEMIHSVVSARDQGEQVDYFGRIRDVCKSHGLSFKDRTKDQLEEVVDLRIAIGWRWLLPNQNRNLIVIHDSLLPRYRGFNPLVSALLNREKFVGATMLYAEATYDSGPIIAQDKFKVKYPIEIGLAIEQMAQIYCSLLLRFWGQLRRGHGLPTAKAQVERLASYSLWRDEEDYRISWQHSASEIEHFIRVVGFPYLGASAFLNGELVRISQANTLPKVRLENPVVGKVLFLEEGRPVVVCGEGLLKISAMTSVETGKNLLPLKKFRSRFS